MDEPFWAKTFSKIRQSRDNARVETVKADGQRRVRLPDARPGQVFAYQFTAQGVISLTPVKKSAAATERPAKVRFEKRGRFTVAITDRPIDERAIKALLADSI
jgi:hypothetical protein